MKRNRVYLDFMAEDPENTERRQPPNQSTYPDVRHIYCLKFEGKQDKVLVPYNKTMDVQNSMTMECWVYLNQPCTGYLIAKKQSFALAVKRQTNSVLMISLNNTKPGWIWKSTKHSIDVKKWTHVACTYDAERMEAIVYVDGNPVKVFDSMQGSISTTDNDLYFGLHLSEDYINGMLLDVRLWRVALTKEKIQQYMKEPPSEADPALIGWWPLDKGYGIDIEDKSVNQLHGELSGAQWTHSNRDNEGSQSTLYENLKAMFNNPVGSDIKLRTSGDPNEFIYAHKIILCERSKVFRAMLLGEMKESTAKEITINDITFPVLSKLIEYLYTDKVELDGDTVLELFTAADKFDQPHLKHMCEKFMLQHINVTNVCTVLELADTLNSALLRGECMRWIFDHFGEVMRTEEYLNLDKKLLAEINRVASKQFFASNKKTKLNDGTAVLLNEVIEQDEP
jgi:hypothetical protein